jgi:hypothetical protein
MDAYGSLMPVLEVTVHGCSNLKNISYFTKLHPYVWLNYVGLEFRTTTHRGGGMNPKYGQKFYFRLIEDVDQLDVQVYSKSTVTSDSCIGSGRVYLGTVLSTGHDETAWPIVDKRNRYAGEVRLTMQLLHSQIQQPRILPSAPPSRTESSENGDLPILSGDINNASINSIVENIGLFIFNKALEYIGLKLFGRK